MALIAMLLAAPGEVHARISTHYGQECHDDTSVMAYTPAFSAEGGSNLGINTATLINLAILKTLREAPFPNPHNLNFGRGCVEWTLDPLSAQQPPGRTLVEIARDYDAQMVLDGEAFPFGTGAVVTARLYMTPRPRNGPLSKEWRIAITPHAAAPGSPISSSPLVLLEDAIPEREFEFRSVALVGADLAAYESPAMLEVHSGGPNGPVIGRIGDGFRALRQDAASAEVVTYAGIHGYIATPIPRREVIAIGHFVGAVIRLLRSDWSGAVTLFSELHRESALPVSMSVDALLMSAYCVEQDGRDGRALVEQAAALSPSAPRVMKFRSMVILAHYVRSAKSGDRSSMQQLASEYHRAVAMLTAALGGDDPWVQQAHAILIEISGA